MPGERSHTPLQPAKYGRESRWESRTENPGHRTDDSLERGHNPRACQNVSGSSCLTKPAVCRRQVSPEAIGFLSAAGVFIVLLAVLFLFINKKLCFEKIGNLPCLDQRAKRKRPKEKSGVLQGL
ncbi:hypothetical protein FKM82_022500, partial [Ascaphus truei]